MNRIITKIPVFEGKEIRILEYEIEVENKNIKWEVIERNDGVVVVPITKEKTVCLIKEYSPAVDKYILTLPGGKTTATKDEELVYEAQRELREETGYRANKMIKLRYYYDAPSLITRKIHLFMGLNLEYDPLYSGEKDEIIKPIFMNLDEAINRLSEDFVSDTSTLGSLLLAREKLKSLGLL